MIVVVYVNSSLIWLGSGVKVGRNRESELAEIYGSCCVAYMAAKLIDICYVMCMEVVFQKSSQMVT